MEILPTYQIGTCMYVDLSGGGGDAGRDGLIQQLLDASLHPNRVEVRIWLGKRKCFSVRSFFSC